MPGQIVPGSLGRLARDPRRRRSRHEVGSLRDLGLELAQTAGLACLAFGSMLAGLGGNARGWAIAAAGLALLVASRRVHGRVTTLLATPGSLWALRRTAWPRRYAWRELTAVEIDAAPPRLVFGARAVVLGDDVMQAGVLLHRAQRELGGAAPTGAPSDDLAARLDLGDGLWAQLDTPLSDHYRTGWLAIWTGLLACGVAFASTTRDPHSAALAVFGWIAPCAVAVRAVGRHPQVVARRLGLLGDGLRLESRAGTRHIPWRDIYGLGTFLGAARVITAGGDLYFDGKRAAPVLERLRAALELRRQGLALPADEEVPDSALSRMAAPDALDEHALSRVEHER